MSCEVLIVTLNNNKKERFLSPPAHAAPRGGRQRGLDCYWRRAQQHIQNIFMLLLPWRPRVLRPCDMEYVMLHLIFSLPHA